MTAWIAFFAIMLASLMPTVSRAMAAAASDSSTQVCSTSHHDAMPAAGHHAPAPEHGALHLDHCAFCLTHAGSFGLPATVAVALPILAGPAVHPAPIFQSRRALVAWTTAQSRAPPLAS